MTDIQVVDIAKEMAEVFGIKMDERKVLSNIKSGRAFTPVIVCNRRVTIWVDKNCVKLCENGDIDITYIYVTKQGAKDELRDTLDKLNYVEGQNEFITLTGITRQLHRALTYMKANGADYYLFSEDAHW